MQRIYDTDTTIKALFGGWLCCRICCFIALKVADMRMWVIDICTLDSPAMWIMADIHEKAVILTMGLKVSMYYVKVG
jgi:hypothetical protein